jgi:hypothetical protein
MHSSSQEWPESVVVDITAIRRRPPARFRWTAEVGDYEVIVGRHSLKEVRE